MKDWDDGIEWSGEAQIYRWPLSLSIFDQLSAENKLVAVKPKDSVGWLIMTSDDYLNGLEWLASELDSYFGSNEDGDSVLCEVRFGTIPQGYNVESLGEFDGW